MPEVRAAARKAERQAAREGQAGKPLVGAGSEAEFGSNGILPANGAGVSGTVARLGIQAAAGEITGEQNRNGVSVDLVNDDPVEIGLEVTKNRHSFVVEALDQRQVDDHYHERYPKILIQQRHDFG